MEYFVAVWKQNGGSKGRRLRSGKMPRRTRTIHRQPVAQQDMLVVPLVFVPRQLRQQQTRRCLPVVYHPSLRRSEAGIIT